MISSVWEEKVCSAIVIPFKRIIEEVWYKNCLKHNMSLYKFTVFKKKNRQQNTNLKVTDIWSWYNYVELILNSSFTYYKVFKIKQTILIFCSNLFLQFVLPCCNSVYLQLHDRSQSQQLKTFQHHQAPFLNSPAKPWSHSLSHKPLEVSVRNSYMASS